MSLAEALETTRIHRVAGLTGARTALVTTRPCRALPHTISDVGLIGGGQGSLAPWGGMPQCNGTIAYRPHASSAIGPIVAIEHALSASAER